MASQQEHKNGNGANKVLGQALAIATLMAAFTGLFMPVKHYVDRQDELEKLVTELSTRLTVLETRLELLQK